MQSTQPLALLSLQGYPDHMVFSEFRRRFDVLAPHLTKKHGRNYIVTDEKRVSRFVSFCVCLQLSAFPLLAALLYN